MDSDFFNGGRPLRVFISGQKFFGAEVLRLCLKMGLDVVGVCCPLDDKYIGRLAKLHGIRIVGAGLLNYDTMPSGVDLGITAHSFDYIGKLTRYKPALGWIGYHPSLLPRHRGRSSIEWAIRFGDFITGGTVFWLNAGVDRGDIERQEYIWIKPKYFQGCPKKAASEMWRGELLPLGVKLIGEALTDISMGVINRAPQRPEFSTFEPSTDAKDIFKPDLLMLPQPQITHK